MQSLSLDAGRLELQSYPFATTLPLRWSDVRGDRIGDLCLPLYFEDARAALIRDLLVSAGYEDGNLRAVMARLCLMYRGRAGYPGELTIGSGLIGIGGSSYAFAQAAFQDGRCVALCDSFAVTVGPDRRPVPIEDRARKAMQHGLRQFPDGAETGVQIIRPQIERLQLDIYGCHEEFATRFPDTDAIGHLNNLGLLRYYEDARVAALPRSLSDFQVRHMQVIYLGQSEYTKPLLVATGIAAMGDDSLEVAQALFQEGRCVGICDTGLGGLWGIPASRPLQSTERVWLQHHRLTSLSVAT